MKVEYCWGYEDYNEDSVATSYQLLPSIDNALVTNYKIGIPAVPEFSDFGQNLSLYLRISLYFNYVIENKIGGREDWSDVIIEERSILVPVKNDGTVVNGTVDFNTSSITSS